MTENMTATINGDSFDGAEEVTVRFSPSDLAVNIMGREAIIGAFDPETPETLRVGIFQGDHQAVFVTYHAETNVWTIDVDVENEVPFQG